jgi:uncharacterized membrane protein
MSDQTGSVTSDDRLWSALGYPIALIAIIMLLMEEKKARPFIKFHAVQAIAFNVVLWVLIFVMSFVTLGFGALCVPLLWLVTLWPAMVASPAVAVESVARKRIVVDLPAPLGPMKPQMVRSAISIVRSSTAVSAPKRLVK